MKQNIDNRSWCKIILPDRVVGGVKGGDKMQETKKIINKIKDAQWRDEPYRRQNWGNWLHRMGAYVGRIKPSMAYWLVKECSHKGEIVLDPFCGVGTIPLEADFLGRIGIGIDLNPYAYSISRAKFDRQNIESHMEWIDSLNIDTSKINLSKYPHSVRKFYEDETLKEIIFIKEKILKDKKYFLLGCLLGIIHGHRPGHLSAITSLVIPYDPRTEPEYKEVIPRLKQKVKRMYQDGFDIKTNSKAIFGDAREIPLEDGSVDMIISSPPYFNTLDYVSDNRLRLEFLGYDVDKKNILKKELIQDRPNYLNEMLKVGEELKRVLKRGGLCVFILGDLHIGKNVTNTALEISKIYEEIGFKIHEIIEDKMPINKCIPSIYKRLKLDRILIMRNGK